MFCTDFRSKTLNDRVEHSRESLFIFRWRRELKVHVLDGGAGRGGGEVANEQTRYLAD